MILAVLALAALQAGSDRADPDAPVSEAAVIAADKAWSAAEQRGDAAFLEWLLEPGYVSVGPDGHVHDRNAIITAAQTRSDSDGPARIAQVDAWRASHPSRTEVKLFGGTAVVSFVSTKAGSAGEVNSSDVFVYRSGHWHPIYSQHSSAGT